MRVLIVDDDPGVREALSDSVLSLGYECQTAEDGEEAWQLFRVAAADTVITDWMMPGTDGLELCRRIREELDAPYTFIIMLTALSDEAHVVEAMKSGADDYLTKPYSLTALQARLVTAERVIALQRRREVHVRLARRFGAETNPDVLVREVLAEGVALVGGEAGGLFRDSAVSDGDEENESQGEALNWYTEPLMATGIRERLAVQQAHETLLELGGGEAILENDFQRHFLPEAAERMTPVQAAVAVPLKHAGRTLGTLVVVRFKEWAPFSQQDVEVLELVSSIAASALAERERALMAGELAEARANEAAMRRGLGSAAGFTQDVANDQGLPGELRGRAGEVLHGVQSALENVRSLLEGGHRPDRSDGEEESVRKR